HLLVEAHVEEAHAANVAAGAQAQERDTVAVAGIHVCLDLEHEARERFLPGLHAALPGLAWQRPRGVGGEGSQQLLDAEIIDRGTEEYRRLAPRPVSLAVEGVGRAPHELDLLGERARLGAEKLLRLRAREPLDG